MRKCLAAIVAVLVTQAALAGARLPPKPQQIGEWQGPFLGTQIIKFIDESDGVVCYVYTPMNIPTAFDCPGGKCVTHFNGDIGSISCVKVMDRKK